MIAFILLLFLGSILALIANRSVGFFIVPSSSMDPTLIPGDKLVTIHKATYERGDVVVLNDPDEEGAFLVKRIVALGGDDLSINHEGITLNNAEIQEPYIKEPIQYEFPLYSVPEGFAFVLGDNRNTSADSHQWGHGIPIDTIVGQVRYIYGPKERTKTLASADQTFIAATP